MAATSGNLPASKPKIVIDDLVSKCPERDIIFKPTTEDGSSIVDAVKQIIALTTAAAIEAAAVKGPPPHKKYSSRVDALWLHLGTVNAVLIALGKRIPHDQQSKLVEFTAHLQQARVSDPTNVGILSFEGRRVWLDMPYLSRNFADVSLRDSGDCMIDQRNIDFANLTAFLAQLAEIKFMTYHESIDWNLFSLQCIFREDHQVTKQDIRVACMWLIYAPEKVWTDIQLGRKIDIPVKINQFKPEFWPKWKEFLQGLLDRPTDAAKDQDIQDLMQRALQSMNNTEATK
ncbi:unnamed protein product [Clonostachys rosea]|uniref:Fungal-type protein kinase domain-containing protein n=1 Tax=Bionectria ochroleuca TaxID=29856 RepID=A0ABY6U1K5_BIOOC|nr:unnamed protein product [Clonostachys rosea]